MTELSGDVRIAAGDENDILNFHSRDSFDGEQQHLSVEIDSNTPPATQDATDGDTELSVDVAVCRVCHCEGDDDHPLFHPCKCAGSIRFIHQDCLTSWLNFSKKANCELCGETFGFRNIYADNMPPKISWWELIIELYPSVIKVAGSIGAVLCHLLFVWVVVPYVTFLELLWCLFYLLEENLDPKWYICESPSDCIIMWFLGLSVTLFLCFLSLIVVHCFQLIYPTQIYPVILDCAHFRQLKFMFFHFRPL